MVLLLERQRDREGREEHTHTHTHTLTHTHTHTHMHTHTHAHAHTHTHTHRVQSHTHTHTHTHTQSETVSEPAFPLCDVAGPIGIDYVPVGPSLDLQYHCMYAQHLHRPTVLAADPQMDRGLKEGAGSMEGWRNRGGGEGG